MTNAAELTKKLTTRELVNLFNTCDDPNVTGWVMDEIETREPIQFEAWALAGGEEKELEGFILIRGN